MTKNKKYADFTAEEKAAYKAKREAYWQKRAEDTANAFNQLEAELKKLKASEEVFRLLEVARGQAKGQSANRETYLTAIFETENPEVGQSASYLQIGVRGPNGERIGKNESMAQFVTRVGDCTYKYDANTISSMLWYLKKRGFKLTNDRKAATVTFNGKDA